MSIHMLKINPTVDVDAVLNFVGSNLIGGQFESSNDSMSYFCGYLLKKLITYHLQHTKSDFSTCECCSNALSSQDLSFHLFVSFKEYKDHENSSQGLKYCSQQFLEVIITYESFFIYYFHHYSHLNGFSRILYDIIRQHAPHPLFCSGDILESLIKFFIKCRIHQTVKYLNKKFSIKSESDKIRKLMHK